VNPAQARTARGCAIAAVGAFLIGVFLLYVELTGASAGQHATISELFWIMWARQPWVIFLVSLLVSNPISYLFGHFTAQAGDKYDRVRAGQLA
jgi:hypothetical protein